MENKNEQNAKYFWFLWQIDFKATIYGICQQMFAKWKKDETQRKANKQ